MPVDEHETGAAPDWARLRFVVHRLRNYQFPSEQLRVKRKVSLLKDHGPITTGAVPAYAIGTKLEARKKIIPLLEALR